MPNSEPTPTVALFVALQEEVEVLVDKLELEKLPGKVRAKGSLDGVDVLVLSPYEMGRVAAAVTVTRYLASPENHHPDLIIAVGLAGGIAEESITEGKVVVGKRVMDLSLRKVTDTDDGESSSSFRRVDYRCAQQLYDFIQSNKFDLEKWRAAAISSGDWPDHLRPSIAEGAIGSTDEVVASNKHRKELSKNGVKLLAVEMETGGVGAAAEEFNVPMAVVRVVSDQADPAKADTVWRKRGMRTLAELLRHLPLSAIIEEIKK